MSETSDDMLEQFVIETRQHIDEIEPILLVAEWEAPDKQGIAALFRCFHSIKGLARLLDLRGLETLAHHAESLLGEVRAEKLAFTPAIHDLLMQALDAIRALRERCIEGGRDSPAPDALVAALQAAARADPPVGASAAPRPAASVPALHDDADTLEYFAEMLRDTLRNLAAPQGDTEEDIETLTLAVERLGLRGLRHRLQGFAEAPSIDRLAALIVDARGFGRLTGHDTGADALAHAIAPQLHAARAAVAADVPSAVSVQIQLRLSLAMAPSDDLAPLLAQALSHPDTDIAPAARLLAAGGEGPDIETLRQAIGHRDTLPAPLLKLLLDRGVDPSRVGAIGPEAMARLATLADGADRHLCALAIGLPPPDALPAFATWLERTFQPVVAEPGQPHIALLLVTPATPQAIQADCLAAFPALDHVEAHRLDGQFHDHPWAAAQAARPAVVRPAEDTQVRVPVEILDRLFGRIGEFFNISSALNVLVVDSQVPAVLQRLNDHMVMQAPALLPAMDILQRQQSDLAQIEAEVHRLVSLIHEATLGLRVIPLDILFNRFPRMIRDLAKEQGKQIRFEAQSNGIKVDKGMTELLGDPLMHILRNSVDHGIEPAEARLVSGKPMVARITLTAVQNGNRIAVEIADDGRGIDAERVRRRAVAQSLVTEADSHKLTKDQIHRFIFAPGFSTAEAVTATSGRGVGMDVALVNISRLGGRIDIQTEPEQGTIFRLDMPLSAAMQTVLLAETAVQTVAFPERMVIEAVTVTLDQVQHVNGQRALLLHDRFLPLFRLTDLLSLPHANDPSDAGDISLVVVAVDGSRYGVEVNRVLRRHEMLIRETHPRIAQLPGIGGVSTLGTDRIVLVIDPDGLTDLARRAVSPGLRAAAPAMAAE